MQDLIQALLHVGSLHLATDEAACAAIVAVRYPNGISCPRCGSECTRAEAIVTCARRHRFTIFHGTPFGSKHKPNARALLLALQAMSSSSSQQSYSARALARLVGAKHCTIWRHLQTLRVLLPAAPPSTLSTTILKPPPSTPSVQITGRASAAPRAWVKVGADHNDERVAGESVRAFLNGTYCGVTARWLCRYVRELVARRCADASAFVAGVLTRLLSGPALFFSTIEPPRHCHARVKRVLR